MNRRYTKFKVLMANPCLTLDDMITMAIVTHAFYLVIYLLLFVAVVLVSRKTRSILRRLKCQLKDQEHDAIQLQGPATDTVNPEQQSSHPPDSGSIQEEPEYEELEQKHFNSVPMIENIAYICTN